MNKPFYIYIYIYIYSFRIEQYVLWTKLGLFNLRSVLVELIIIMFQRSIRLYLKLYILRYSFHFSDALKLWYVKKCFGYKDLFNVFGSHCKDPKQILLVYPNISEFIVHFWKCPMQSGSPIKRLFTFNSDEKSTRRGINQNLAT